ncbi:3-hydroxyacyl-ACP dehydratase FabZ family protein [Motilibacter deserti]|uniref:ApeI dehydratase-like domain-containing protein n=1 Tax=Motilibacter deserti TaxID=2714956 RepID=A0ABX0GYL3_9ACTN|nr:hypothetical protein [Motilibacter deserti]
MPSIRAAARPLDAVDEVTVVSADEVLARKRVTAVDPYLRGHYPDLTIYPGVFVVESVRQAALRLLEETRPEVTSAVLVGIDSVRFTAPFVPGDDLRLRATCTGPDSARRVSATVTKSGLDVDDAPAAQVTLTLALFQEDGDA